MCRRWCSIFYQLQPGRPKRFRFLFFSRVPAAPIRLPNELNILLTFQQFRNLSWPTNQDRFPLIVYRFRIIWWQKLLFILAKIYLCGRMRDVVVFNVKSAAALQTCSCSLFLALNILSKLVEEKGTICAAARRLMLLQKRDLQYSTVLYFLSLCTSQNTFLRE